jgi:hypothetical protein
MKEYGRDPEDLDEFFSGIEAIKIFRKAERGE